MSEYNVSTLIKIMMDAFADTQVNTGSIILNVVAAHPNVNVDVDGKMISNLMKRKVDIHGDIRSGAGKTEVRNWAREEVKKKVLPKINPVLLDDTCDRILKAMDTDTNVSNGFCEKMQQLYASNNFQDFFTDAILYALSVTNMPPEETTQEEDFMLLREADYRCPLDGTKLWKKKKGKYSYQYRIVKIYPEGLDDEMADEFSGICPPQRSLDMDSNKIALCRDCAEDYLDDPTPEMYQKLLECKGNVVRQHKKAQISAESDIEDEIVDVIKAIAGINADTELKPFTDALEIKQKILPENWNLGVGIRDDVVRYYPFIEKQFSLLDSAEGSTFNIIRSEVTTCYEKYEREGLNQMEVFDALADWILQTKGLGKKHRVAATVMISFFVQNCAVFKKYQADEEGTGVGDKE